MQRYRVCVADDNEDVASVLCEGLKANGYDAFAVHSGEEALEAARDKTIDLMLLDVCFPGINGYEVCKRLKGDPRTAHIVVIFVTVKGTREDITRGYDLGAADYIVKPYNLPMVMLRVEGAMRARAAQDALLAQDDHYGDSGYTDSLTGLRNRRFLLERLDEEVEEAHRYDYPVSCVVFDLDEVCALDEELGPASLDDLLAELAMSMRNYSRTYDVLARYDGTVFVTVLPHAPLENAVDYAAKILADVEATTFSDPSFPTQLRLRAGVVTCRNGAAKGAEFVMGEAMRSLLQARSRRADGHRLVARNLS